MLGKSTEQRVIESNAKALRKGRISKGLCRKELARKLNVTNKAIEKIENARDKLSDERLGKIIEAIGISDEEFLKLKRGREINQRPRQKNVLNNSDRRSYKKIITKEVKALKALRVLGKFSQDKASYLCGYSRPSIGHIENGRIAVAMRHEIIEQCNNKILDLPDEKLNLLKALLIPWHKKYRLDPHNNVQIFSQTRVSFLP